jgi:hypothetical protein
LANCLLITREQFAYTVSICAVEYIADFGGRKPVFCIQAARRSETERWHFV